MSPGRRVETQADRLATPATKRREGSLLSLSRVEYLVKLEIREHTDFWWKRRLAKKLTLGCVLAGTWNERWSGGGKVRMGSCWVSRRAEVAFDR